MKDIHLENSLKLSLLSLSENEEQKFVEKFEKVIGMLNRISGFDVGDDFKQKICELSDLREDEVLPSLKIESIKNFSNLFLDGYFPSPKVLE
ncbi:MULTISPECIES: Asp-tRNA(Asn)/Glu-tRNA(Gln) amidotransferase subunit GatC [unclassified Borrelia]|uniref:Asp-tRNA(Asn)/Glu-tRNA(Gln) amidotransferase subunit GatC n=1 Tax=unclassified Borrelia TaxID=2649934 RepID=UPI001E439005|nr:MULTISPECIES: Asp-tRNA(Asn)/Glu-tRNA(Gln) amidotransferase subunit GatC [unclassified Borrelia]UGQ16031.1 Asp-tRNA(Asn)/Glu-tRNA(Gln) amidotransferase subunit GatC [Borrelia sp. RT5S]UGQ17143.1 Asp-tRNA(Asn)/Glu-tRNA(Gln) amidotransferase subunit GatC [Borrelia sp. RT1S]